MKIIILIYVFAPIFAISLEHWTAPNKLKCGTQRPINVIPIELARHPYIKLQPCTIFSAKEGGFLLKGKHVLLNNLKAMVNFNVK